MTDTTRPATEVARCPVAHGTDFTDPDLIQAGLPMPEFAYLRQNRPLYWNPQTRENSSYDDGGFWLATRWEDVRNISSAREGWSSEENTAIVKFEGHIGREERDLQRMMMINMDDPRIAALCLRLHVDGVEKLVPLVEALNTDWIDMMNNPTAAAAVKEASGG